MPSYHKPLAYTCLGLSAAAAVTSIVTGLLALEARQDFDDTDLQRPAHEASERYRAYGNAALATGVVAGVSGLLAWISWPEAGAADRGVSVGGVAGAGAGISLRWRF